MTYIPPKFSMLNRQDCLRLHQASLQILHQTGIQVFQNEALQLLKDAGAQVLEDRIRIPPSLVEWALASAPESFSLYARGSETPAILLDGEGVYFGPGSPGPLCPHSWLPGAAL